MFSVDKQYIFPCRSRDDLLLSYKKTVKLLKESLPKEYLQEMDDNSLEISISNWVQQCRTGTLKEKRYCINILLICELLLKFKYVNTFIKTRIEKFIKFLNVNYEKCYCLKINPSYTIFRLQWKLYQLRPFEFCNVPKILINELAIVGMKQECKEIMCIYSLGNEDGKFVAEPFYPEYLSPELRKLYKSDRMDRVFQAILGFVTFVQDSYIRMPPYLLEIILDHAYQVDFIFGPTCIIKMIDLVHKSFNCSITRRMKIN